MSFVDVLEKLSMDILDKALTAGMGLGAGSSALLNTQGMSAPKRAALVAALTAAGAGMGYGTSRLARKAIFGGKKKKASLTGHDFRRAISDRSNMPTSDSQGYAASKLKETQNVGKPTYRRSPTIQSLAPKMSTNKGSIPKIGAAMPIKPWEEAVKEKIDATIPKAPIEVGRAMTGAAIGGVGIPWLAGRPMSWRGAAIGGAAVPALGWAIDKYRAGTMKTGAAMNERLMTDPLIQFLQKEAEEAATNEEAMEVREDHPSAMAEDPGPTPEMTRWVEENQDFLGRLFNSRNFRGKYHQKDI